MGKDSKEQPTIPELGWDEKTEETEIPRMDGFEKSVADIRDALKKRPTLQGYMALIEELLNRELLDEAVEATEEFKRWEKQNK